MVKKIKYFLIAGILSTVFLSACSGTTEMSNDTDLGDKISEVVQEKAAANSSIPPENMTAVPSESVVMPPKQEPSEKEKKLLQQVKEQNLFTANQDSVLAAGNYICNQTKLKAKPDLMLVYVQAMLGLGTGDTPISEESVKKFIDLTQKSYC